MGRYRNSSGERIRVAGERITSCDCCGDVACCSGCTLPSMIAVTLDTSITPGTPADCCWNVDGTYVLDYVGVFSFACRWEYGPIGGVFIRVEAAGGPTSCNITGSATITGGPELSCHPLFISLTDREFLTGCSGTASATHTSSSSNCQGIMTVVF